MVAGCDSRGMLSVISWKIEVNENGDERPPLPLDGVASSTFMVLFLFLRKNNWLRRPLWINISTRSLSNSKFVVSEPYLWNIMNKMAETGEKLDWPNNINGTLQWHCLAKWCGFIKHDTHCYFKWPCLTKKDIYKQNNRCTNHSPFIITCTAFVHCSMFTSSIIVNSVYIMGYFQWWVALLLCFSVQQWREQ